jgi:hypothetical protein
MATYIKQRDEMNAQMGKQLPAGLLSGFAAAERRLDELDFSVRAPKVGDQAPDCGVP